MYKSKREIYKDYQIAIKLGIDRGYSISKNSYKELYKKLPGGQNKIIKELEWSIENFNSKHPTSSGVFVEVPQKAPSGEQIGVRYFILEHESGPELFLKAAEFLNEHVNVSDIATNGIITGAIYKLIAKKSVDKFVTFLIKKWNETMNFKIAYVEIRTEEKGVMRVHFEDFRVFQLECLINSFSHINHLSDVNYECFGGKWFDPSSPNPLSND